MTYPAWILTLLLALSMLVSPMSGAGTTDLPHFSCSIDFSDDSVGEDRAMGLVQTTDVQSAFYASMTDGSFYLTGEQAVIVLPDRTISVPASDFIALLYGMTGSLPAPTEADAYALMTFAQSLVSIISPDAFVLAPAGDGFMMELNVDALLADLDTGVPQLLTAHADQLDPIVRKYSLALTGQAYTCAQLADIWPQLGLGGVRTGLTIKLSVLPQQDGSVTFLGGVADLTFIGRIGEDGFDLRFTTPDDVSYQLDSADLFTVSLIASQAFSGVGHEAFMFTESHDTLESGYQLVTYEAHLNTTALARDLNRGFAEAIRARVDTVNALLDKYRSWIALFDPQLAQTITADSLAATFDAGLITLPHAIGLLTVTDDMGTRTAKIDGSLNQATLTGKISYGDETSGSLLFTIDDRHVPVTIDADFLADPDAWFCSLSSNHPIFDAINTLTVSYDGRGYGDSFLITTDTNAFRLAYSSPEQYMELKLGEVNAYLRQDGSDAFHVNVYHPEFFADLHAGEEFVSLDSTFFGLDFAPGRNDTFTLNGYIAPEADARYDFGLKLHESGSYMDSFSYGYFTGDDVDISAVYVRDSLYITVDGELYSVVRDSETSALLLCHNHGIFATIYSDVTDDLVTLRIYEEYAGKDHTLPPLCTVTIDLDPAPLSLPTGTQVTDVHSFIHTLVNLLQ